METHALLDHPLAVRLSRLLTEPAPAVTHPRERRRAATLAALLFTYLPITLVALLIALLTNSGVGSAWLGFVAIAVCYGLSRTRFYRVGGSAAMLILWLMPFILTMTRAEYPFNTDLFIIEWTILAVFLAMVLLRGLIVVLFLSATMLGTMIVGITNPPITTEFILFSVSFLTMIVALVVVVTLLRREDIRQRVQVETSLRAREERYRMITEFMSDYAYAVVPATDERWRIEWVEGAWTAITGIAIEQAHTVNWRDLVLETDMPVLQVRMEQLLSDQRSVVEYRIRRADGTIRWIRDYGYPVWDDSRQHIVRVYGAGQDITTRKEAELAAAEQQQLASSLRDTAAVLSSTLDQNEVLNRILDEVYRLIMPDAADIMLIDNGVARIVRSRGSENYGITSEQLGSLTFTLDSMPNLRTMYDTGAAVRITDVRTSADWVDLSITAWMRSYLGVPIILDGITMGFINLTGSQVGMFNDAHAVQLRAFADQAAVAIRNAVLFEEVRRYADALSIVLAQRNDELSLERERLRVILEATAEGVIYTEDSIFRYVNAAFALLTGYTPDELIGKRVTILASPQASGPELSDLLDSITRHLTDFGTWRGALNMTRKDGTAFVAGLTVSPIARDAQSPRAVTIVRDITREKILQQQQSQFVAHASHELRTPITNFTTRLYLLRRDPTNLERHLLVLEDLSERMRRLVSDLLDLSRYERGVIPFELQEQPIQPLLMTVVRDQTAEAERKHIMLRSEMPQAPVLARVDGERIIQVITNLVTNAINYTASGGSIQVSLSAHPDDKTAIIRVQDTGIGIAPEHLPLIFQPFYRVASEIEGTGLGLSIAREIVEQHGGTITVSSQLGVGSRFEIVLSMSETTTLAPTVSALRVTESAP